MLTLCLLTTFSFAARAQERPWEWGNLPDLFDQGEVALSRQNPKEVYSGIIQIEKSPSNQPPSPPPAHKTIIYGSDGAAKDSEPTVIDVSVSNRGITVIKGAQP